MFIAGFDARS